MAVKVSVEELDDEVPVTCLDYVRPKSMDHESENTYASPILVGGDRKSKLVFAHVVLKKGHDPHTLKIASREIRLSGYSKVVFKSDQGRVITGQKTIYQPTFCVKGRRLAGAHRRVKGSVEELDDEVPVISLDYIHHKSRERKSENIYKLFQSW